MKGKLISALLVGAVLFPLAGCGSSEPTPAESPAESPAASPTTSP